MLAEPRRRQRYSVNPRGTDWSNDETKFGHQLLEKMGWKKGNGLGLREDGNKEHIKVTTKSDRKGVGCSQQHSDNWIAHQDDFSAILSSLNSDSPADTSGVAFSLHSKSKACRTRVHYEKFTRGKDLSSYNTTDMKSIFGQRQSTTTKSSVNECSTESSSGVDSSSGVSPGTRTDGCGPGTLGTAGRSGAGRSTNATSDAAGVDQVKSSRVGDFNPLFLTSSTTIGDYFAVKMAQLKNKTRTADRPADSGNTEHRTADSFIEHGIESKSKKKKKKKAKKMENGSCEAVNSKDCEPESSPRTTDDLGERVKKHKRSRDRKELTNSEHEDDSKKQKKKRKKKRCDSAGTISC